MTPIRPAGYPATPPANPAADQARLAAQRAFFDQAMGRAGGPRPAQAAAPAPVTAATAPTLVVRPSAAASQSQAGEPAAKPLRPGSLLDIRV